MRSLILLIILSSCSASKTVLVISKTEGYRHSSIEKGVEVVSNISTELNFEVISTEDTSLLLSEDYDIVVFLNTTGDILDKNEQETMRTFVNSGGGFVGIHSAADTEHEWSWYGEELLGAWFVSHPPVCEETILVVNSTHSSTKHLPSQWVCTDEWYEYDRTPEGATILMMVQDHPLSWCKELGNGRSFYTGRGHTIDSYSDPHFTQHLKGGIEWVSE